MVSTESVATNREVATLAGGCFWCLEAVFRQLRGVERAVSGFIGGQSINPTYKQVCGGDTGHAEAVQIAFDPAVISFGELLAVFFSSHNPTTLNRQGNDIGTQYRSGIFYHSPEQHTTALEMIAEINAAHVWSDPIVTEITLATVFYPAEDYHQDYFANNVHQHYCQVVVASKVAHVREMFPSKIR